VQRKFCSNRSRTELYVRSLAPLEVHRFQAAHVDPTFFDTRLTIQQVTSTKVHEASYDGWESKHLRLILSSLTEVLRESFVVPAVREDKRRAILKLRDDVIAGKAGGTT
jgi:hypothetical protein